MNLRDAFEQGYIRGQYMSKLRNQLQLDGISDTVKDVVEKQIEFIQQEIHEYTISLGGTTKELKGLTIRTNDAYFSAVADKDEIW